MTKYNWQWQQDNSIKTVIFSLFFFVFVHRFSCLQPYSECWEKIKATHAINNFSLWSSTFHYLACVYVACVHFCLIGSIATAASFYSNHIAFDLIRSRPKPQRKLQVDSTLKQPSSPVSVLNWNGQKSALLRFEFSISKLAHSVAYALIRLLLRLRTCRVKRGGQQTNSHIKKHKWGNETQLV